MGTSSGRHSKNTRNVARRIFTHGFAARENPSGLRRFEARRSRACLNNPAIKYPARYAGYHTWPRHPSRLCWSINMTETTCRLGTVPEEVLRFSKVTVLMNFFIEDGCSLTNVRNSCVNKVFFFVKCEVAYYFFTLW